MHMSSASLREGGGGGGHTWENVGTLTQILPHVVGEIWGNKGTWSALLGEIGDFVFGDFHETMETQWG